MNKTTKGINGYGLYNFKQELYSYLKDGYALYHEEYDSRTIYPDLEIAQHIKALMIASAELRLNEYIREFVEYPDYKFALKNITAEIDEIIDIDNLSIVRVSQQTTIEQVYNESNS